MQKVHNDEYQRGLASIVYKFFDKKYVTHTNKSAVISTHSRKGIDFGAAPDKVPEKKQLAALNKQPIFEKVPER